MAKKHKQKPTVKRINVAVPSHDDLPTPLPSEEHVLVPIIVETEHVEPLPAPVSFLGVITAEETFIFGTPYFVIAAAPGCKMPTLKTGQLVHVTLSPAPDRQ